MKKIGLYILYIVSIFTLLIILYKMALNGILLYQYNNKRYSEDCAKLLEMPSYLPDYIAQYNYGNILYQQGKYESAIEKYENALLGFVPKYQECKIRINYALAVCKTVQVNERDSKSIKKAINLYEFAIDVLTEKGCANKSDNGGHNADAIQLKKDIQKEIDRLKNLLDEKKQEENEEESEEDENEEEEETAGKEESEKIEEKIQDVKEDAVKRQRQLEDQNSKHTSTYSIRNKNSKHTSTYSIRNKNW